MCTNQRHHLIGFWVDHTTESHRIERIGIQSHPFGCAIFVLCHYLFHELLGFFHVIRHHIVRRTPHGAVFQSQQNRKELFARGRTSVMRQIPFQDTLLDGVPTPLVQNPSIPVQLLFLRCGAIGRQRVKRNKPVHPLWQYLCFILCRRRHFWCVQMVLFQCSKQHYVDIFHLSMKHDTSFEF